MSILDYDKLVEAYTSNLDVTLRGFRPAEEKIDLDTWVPDDDAARSLSSLVEAAQIGGSDSVSMRVGKKTLQEHTPESLKDKLSSLGVVNVVTENDAFVFEVTKLQETAAFRSVRPVYLHQLRRRSEKLSYNRTLKTGEASVPLRAVENGYSLAIAVQPDKHIVTDAVFEGPVIGPTPAVLDQLCEILIGLPLQEARDHGVIRLEFSLRDPNLPTPISGIVLPQNADPLFRTPLALVKRLFEDYKTSTNYRPEANFYDPGVRPDWGAMTPEQREQRVAQAVKDKSSLLGIEAEDVHIIECRYPYAVTVQFSDRLTIPAKRKLALSLERVVREECDPRLEVFCEEKKDLSKLRRL